MIDAFRGISETETEVELTPNQIKAQELLERKMDSKQIDKKLKSLRDKIIAALDAGARYGTVDKLEKEFDAYLTYLRNTGMVEKEKNRAVIASKGAFIFDNVRYEPKQNIKEYVFQKRSISQ